MNESSRKGDDPRYSMVQYLDTHHKIVYTTRKKKTSIKTNTKFRIGQKRREILLNPEGTVTRHVGVRTQPPP